MTNLAISLVEGNTIPDGTPSATVFPTVGVGDTSTLGFNFSNLGPGTLTIDQITVPEGFALDPAIAAQLALGPLAIAQGQSRTVAVSLTRMTVGEARGNFVVRSNDAETLFYNFPLVGTVVPSVIGADGSPFAVDELIPLVTALGEPAPGSVGNRIADGPESSRLVGIDINDLITAGQGNDLIFGEEGSDYIFAGQGADTVLGGGGADSLSGDFGDDFLFSGSGGDLVIGRSGNDVLNGNRGNDILGGGEGDDILFGGKDNDVLAGGLGDDILFGDRGFDTLLGGVDVDQYAIAVNTGADVVLDYDDGTDKFLLVGGLTFDALQFEDVMTGVTIRVDGILLTTVLNTTAAELESDDFLTLSPSP